MGLRWHGTAVDAIDPARLGRWWAEVLRVGVVYERPDVVVLPGLTFVRVDDVVSGRSRLHLELDSDDIAADVEKLLDMGARHVAALFAEGVVLADPEGNEFRVRPPR